jgi:CelD/BcsL family acetyltransferase involved in cellulose biosynthesis
VPPSPYLALPSYDPKKSFTVEPRSQGQRTKLRKVNRQLETPAGRLHLVRFDEADRDALQRFYNLEASGWKGREKSAILCVPAVRQFYDQLTEAAGRFGYFTLYELYLDGQHVAGTLGFTYRGRFFTPRGAHHEGFREYAVGHLVIQHVIQDCVKRGLRAFEFLGVPDDWKKLWTSDAREHPTYCVFQRNVASYLLHAVQFRIKPAARSLAAGARARLSSF